MYAQVRPAVQYIPVMPILNRNIVPKGKTKPAIQAMGMAACQCKCLRCTHCSDNHCGNRS